MLEATRPFGAPVRPFLSSQFTFGVARDTWQEQAYWALRHEIFCAETALFASPGHERDGHDAQALPIVALAHSAGNPEAVVGVVRIFAAAAGAGVWYGGRLGVARQYRARPAVGAGLIRSAVTSALALGCQRFLATVLAENAGYFARHHFRPLYGIELCGRAHMLMEASLNAFEGGLAPRSKRCAA